MRKGILFCLVLLSNYAYCQDCNEFQERIDELTEEKKKLVRELGNAELAYDQLGVKFQDEEKERIKYQKLYFVELQKRKKSEKKLEELNKDIENLRQERDKLSAKIKELEGLGKTNSELYNKVLREKRSLDTKVRDATQEKRDYQSSFETEEKHTRLLEEKIKKLEDEANDKVSIQTKTVFFKNKKYGYGEDIIFIPCYNGMSKLILNDENEYLLKRLSKLVSKYDFRVKISFLGKSVLDEQAFRRSLTSQRISKIKSKMIADYGLKVSNFKKGNSAVDDTGVQTGISIRITRR